MFVGKELEPLLHTRLIKLPSPADPNGPEANPVAYSHAMWDAPHQCFLETPSAVRYVYSLYPEGPLSSKILVEVEDRFFSKAQRRAAG
jgi:hypothetical protein